MNLYAETVTAGTSEEPRQVLFRAPGLLRLQTLGDSPVRGLFSVNGRCFAVAGGSFYELTSTTTAVLRGSVTAGTSSVDMASNSVQICVIADGLGYIFTLATNLFVRIAGTAFPTTAVSLTTIDTYFIVLASGTNQFSCRLRSTARAGPV